MSQRRVKSAYMAGYDGTIKINTKLDTDGFAKGANEYLQSKRNYLTDESTAQFNC